MESFEFADKARGIFASKNGRLYVTKPGTFDLYAAPFIIPTPFRIIVDEKYDPFVLIFTKCGHLYILNSVENRWVLQTKLPSIAGVIDSVDLLHDGKNVILKTNKGAFLYDSGWVVLSEPIESLVIKADQKIFAQCSSLENEIAAAIYLHDYDFLVEAILRYVVYLANYAPENAFLSLWYDLIKSNYPFEKEEMKQLWARAIDVLASIDRVSQSIDELQMSVESI
ncbi:hypothetical protein GPJ56_007286 [Histomonas meleagridis]|uniref:uncharacterized protein n=1 Tax=Histomonas meleagridis TaxID=135588 RepID=UPI00355A7D13|nr:hypothetical protein GPJ56_007286 [Histomonas meleagridis]KAH0804132.1 hypothetical protein GO595_002962 [Histomonas meleagridis]